MGVEVEVGVGSERAVFVNIVLDGWGGRGGDGGCGVADLELELEAGWFCCQATV